MAAAAVASVVAVVFPFLGGGHGTAVDGHGEGDNAERCWRLGWRQCRRKETETSVGEESGDGMVELLHLKWRKKQANDDDLSWTLMQFSCTGIKARPKIINSTLTTRQRPFLWDGKKSNVRIHHQFGSLPRETFFKRRWLR